MEQKNVSEVRAMSARVRIDYLWLGSVPELTQFYEQDQAQERGANPATLRGD